MHIVVTGASGFLGRHFVAAAQARGHRVTTFVRSHAEAREGTAYWDPGAGVIEAEALEGCDAVLHLSGERITALRWTRGKKRRIRASRVESTRLLAQALQQLDLPPRLVLSCSAIGVYGNRGEEAMEEAAAPGTGFLANLVQEWEAAAQPMADSATRLVLLRTGVVLGHGDGVLQAMLPAFRLGLGGQLGDGRQVISWIDLDDYIEALFFIIETGRLSGPINMVAPNPVTNQELTRTLGRILHRPALARIPAWLLRLAMGEVADETLLMGTRVLPSKLLATGFSFKFPELEMSLRHVLEEQA